jgi:hypothetical protein
LKKMDVPKPGDKIESVCILWFCFVLLDKHWKWTNMKVWQSDWKQLLWYAMFPLTSDRAQLDFDFWCFNATFNNISAISWRPVLMVEEAGIPGENHRPWASNW